MFGDYFEKQIDFYFNNCESIIEMHAMIFLLFTLTNGQLICRTVNDEPIDGFHLWQRNDMLTCFEDGIKCKQSEYECVIGNSTPPMKDDSYLLKFSDLHHANFIECNTSRNNWTLENIDMDSMNKATFVENDENRYVDIYAGNGRIDVTINLSNEEIYSFRQTGGQYTLLNFTINNNAFINRIETRAYYWTRIHFTPVKTFHAGIWSIVTLSQQPFFGTIRSFLIDVKSNLTCFDNILTTCSIENIPATTELSCHAGQTFNKMSIENVVCKIQNVSLTPLDESRFSFRINSFENKEQVVECFSDQSNQTWTSNPIRYFQRIENTNKAMTFSNLKERDCQYSWITPAACEKIINSHRLDYYRMMVHGFGTYYGTTTCGECSFINYIVNFIDIHSTIPTTTTTTAIPTTTTTTTTTTPIPLIMLKIQSLFNDVYYLLIGIFGGICFFGFVEAMLQIFSICLPNQENDLTEYKTITRRPHKLREVI